MKNFFILIVLLFSITCDATTVLASSFGYNSTNATSAFQQAIQSNNDTIIIDLQSADWNINPTNFFNINNKTIIFQPGVKLKAISGAFNAINACLMRFNNCSNITIIGYQAEFKMNKSEYAMLNNSEYRMSLSLWNCSDFTIKGLTLTESGGDGIYIGGENGNFCSNILIEDVICNNHYRQGMSICSVQNMTVKNCSFTNTQGTLPEAGVDIEPYQTSQRIVNVLFENCSFKNNGWSGLALALFELDSNSIPVSITVRDCYFKNNSLPTNSYGHCELFLSADNDMPVQGTVLFEKCLIDGSQYTALYTRKTSDAYLVKFKDCVFKNVSQLQFQYNEPIFLEVPSYSEPSDYLGGLEFENVYISYPTNFSFFRVFGWSTLQGIKDITGNFTVVEPNNNLPLYTNTPSQVNVNYTFTNQILLPATTINTTIVEQEAVECTNTNGSILFERNSILNNYPLGITYAVSGNAFLGDDTHLLTGGIIIPANTNSRIQEINPRQDENTETDETVIATILSSSNYNLGNQTTSTIIIKECTLSNNDIDALNFRVYPNPFNSELTLFSKTSFQNNSIEVYTIDGKSILKQDGSSSFEQTIVLNSIQKGIYFLKITDEKIKKTVSIKIVKI